jgi:hypothetical protein
MRYPMATSPSAILRDALEALRGHLRSRLAGTEWTEADRAEVEALSIASQSLWLVCHYLILSWHVDCERQQVRETAFRSLPPTQE